MIRRGDRELGASPRQGWRAVCYTLTKGTHGKANPKRPLWQKQGCGGCRFAARRIGQVKWVRCVGKYHDVMWLGNCWKGGLGNGFFGQEVVGEEMG